MGAYSFIGMLDADTEGYRGYISSFSRALENETVFLAANIDDRRLALIPSNRTFFFCDVHNL